MNSKESGEVYIEGLGGRKGTGEMLQLYHNLKNNKKR